MDERETGQALVIVLLIMAVGLTIALSVVSRSTSDIKLSQEEGESARVFSAAESGIEKALIGGAGDYSVDGITAHVTKTAQGGGSSFDFGGGKFAAGQAQSVWLIEHTSKDQLGGASLSPLATINVCWGDDPADKTALEASLIYQDSDGNFKLARGAYDADITRGNNFSPADDLGGNNCGNLAFKKQINLADDFSVPSNAQLYLLRLVPLYNSQPEPLAVEVAGGALPSQGSCYESTAEISQTGTTRKVKQCQFYNSPPAIFDYALFSGVNLVK